MLAMLAYHVANECEIYLNLVPPYPRLLIWICPTRLSMEGASSIVPKHLACAPVTALAFASDDILLVGQGPRLKIFCLRASAAVERDKPSRPAYDEKLLHVNRIHAFVVHSGGQRLVDGASSSEVLVLGGKEVFLIDIEVSQG